MSRRPKFRIWDKQKNDFYKPTYEGYRGEIEDFTIDPSGDLCMRTMNKTIHESGFPDRFEVQQYTGLKDRNGKEIFEGDILRMDDGVKNQFVKWSNWMAGFVMVISDDSGSTDIPTMCEVIGNIYENPELIGDTPCHE